MMLDVRRLEILAAVAEGSSFTAAAQALFLTQSAVSQQMAAFEHELGVVLFRRQPRGVELTPAGEFLAQRARRLLAELHSTEQALERYCSKVEEIRVGAFKVAGSELLPHALRDYAAVRPTVRVELLWMTRDDPFALLRAGEVNLLLIWNYNMDTPVTDPAFVETHLLDDPLDVVLPLGHPLGDQPEVTLSELAGERWIIREHAPPHDRHAIEKMLRMAGMEPDVAFRTLDYHSVQGLVASGFGVALAPRLSVTPHRPDLVVRPVSDWSFARRISTLQLPGPDQPPSVSDLIDVLRKLGAGPR
jgi:DNA-binding transcriptional LysR family regulator